MRKDRMISRTFWIFILALTIAVPSQASAQPKPGSKRKRVLRIQSSHPLTHFKLSGAPIDGFEFIHTPSAPTTETKVVEPAVEKPAVAETAENAPAAPKPRKSRKGFFWKIGTSGVAALSLVWA